MCEFRPFNQFSSELEETITIGDPFSGEEYAMSGGGQGGAPKPPPKIQGGNFRRQQEKKQSYPKPTPRPVTPSKPK